MAVGTSIRNLCSCCWNSIYCVDGMDAACVRMELWQVCDSQDVARAQLTKGLTDTNVWVSWEIPSVELL